MRMNAHREVEEIDAFKEVVNIMGGRLSYLGKTCKAKEMMPTAKHLLQVEKAWLLSQIGLIQDHDDDVMDEVRTQCTSMDHRKYLAPRPLIGSKNGARVLGSFYANLLRCGNKRSRRLKMPLLRARRPSKT